MNGRNFSVDYGYNKNNNDYYGNRDNNNYKNQNRYLRYGNGRINRAMDILLGNE